MAFGLGNLRIGDSGMIQEFADLRFAEALTREKVRGDIVHKDGRKYQHG